MQNITPLPEKQRCPFLALSQAFVRWQLGTEGVCLRVLATSQDMTANVRTQAGRQAGRLEGGRSKARVPTANSSGSAKRKLWE